MADSRARRPSFFGVAAIAFLAIVALIGYWQSAQETELERNTLRGPPPAELSRFEMIRNWVRRGEEAVPEAIEALSDEDPMTRRSAARALSQIGPVAKDAIPVLRQSLADTHEDVRIDAASALVHVIGPSPEVIEEVSSLLDDESEFVRKEMVNLLGRLGALAVPVVSERLRGTHTRSRLLAIDVVRSIMKAPTASIGMHALEKPAPDPALSAETISEIVQLLRPLADDDDRGVRASARISLADSDQATVDELRSWIRETAEDVVVAALGAIDRMGAAAEPLSPDLLSFLQQRVSEYRSNHASQDFLLLQTAINLIARFPSAAGGSSGQILSLVREPDLPTFLVSPLLKLLSRADINRETLVPLLIEFVHHQEFAVGSMASHLLKGIDPAAMREQVPILCGRLKDLEGPALDDALRVIWCLGPMAEAAIPDLIELLRSSQTELQARAAWIIASIGPAAVDAVPEMLRLIRRGASDPDLLEAMITAAGGIGPSAAAMQPFVLQHATIPWQTGMEKQTAGRLHLAAIRAGMRLGMRQPEYLKAVNTDLLGGEAQAIFAAMDALWSAKRPDRSTLPAMLRHLEGRDPPVRMAAALCIVEIVGPEPEVISALSRRLDDSSHDVRMTAADSLGRLGRKAMSALPDLSRALSAEESAIPLRKLSTYSRVWIDSNSFPVPARVPAPDLCIAQVIQSSIQSIESAQPSP